MAARSSSRPAQNTPGPALQPRPAHRPRRPQGAGRGRAAEGRSNYVCHYHLARNLADGRFTTPEDAAHLRAIGRFSTSPRPATRPNAPRCLRTPPPGCSPPRPGTTAWARTAPTSRSASSPPPVARRWTPTWWWSITTLFFADVSLRDGGMGELLPSCNAVIFDEAHQLPETASLFFGESVSTPSSSKLARDTRSETVAAARDCLDLIEATRKLEGRPRPAPHHRHRERPLRLRPARRQQALPRGGGCPRRRARRLLRHRRDPGRALRGLANCLRRTQELQGAWPAGRCPRATSGCAGSRCSASRWPSTPRRCRSPRSSSARWTATRGPGCSPRPRWRWGATSATTAASWASTGSSRPSIRRCGAALRLPEAGHALRPAEHARPNSPDYPDAVARSRVSADPGRPGRTFVLCLSLRSMRPHPRDHRRQARAESSAAALDPGRRLAHRTPRTLPQAR